MPISRSVGEIRPELGESIRRFSVGWYVVYYRPAAEELGVTDEPAPDDKAKKKAERERRKKARQKAKSDSRENSGK